MCFFFQAEDGIRDLTVTGVQTCALPIFSGRRIPARFPVRKDGLVADERPSHHFGRFRHLSQGDVRCGGRLPPRHRRGGYWGGGQNPPAAIGAGPKVTPHLPSPADLLVGGNRRPPPAPPPTQGPAGPRGGGT